VLGSVSYERYEAIVVAEAISGAFKMTLKFEGMYFWDLSRRARSRNMFF
jgi:hypothetical protein